MFIISCVLALGIIIILALSPEHLEVHIVLNFFVGFCFVCFLLQMLITDGFLVTLYKTLKLHLLLRNELTH